MGSLGLAAGPAAPPIVREDLVRRVPRSSSHGCSTPRRPRSLVASSSLSLSSPCSHHALERRCPDTSGSGPAPLKSHAGFCASPVSARPIRLVIRAKAKDRSSAGGSAADLPALEESEPWLGAVVYRRSAARQEFVVVTSLERLALPHLSSPASRAEAAETLVADLAHEPAGSAAQEASAAEEVERAGDTLEGVVAGTPVVVRMRSSREGRDIRLDGTACTVFAMQCHRCLCAVTEPVYSEFSLLLSASPLHEPTKRSLGIILGGSVSDFNSLPADYDYNEDGDMLDLDLDDKLYFPSDQKIIDVSKHIRDAVHLEIPLKVRCSPGCRGMCLGCGANLNLKECACEGEEGWRDGGVDGGAKVRGKGSEGGSDKGLGAGGQRLSAFDGGRGMGMMGGKGGGMGKGSLREQLEQLYKGDEDKGDEGKGGQ